MIELPEWCGIERRDAPLILIAPHGGRRPPLEPNQFDPRLRVNDLKTVLMTRLLAARLGATAIVNSGQDRNTLDLNRLSQIRDGAPWFLTLLANELERLLRIQSRVLVLFIHGWNVMQAACDVGIGAIETKDGIVPSRPDSLSVGPADLAFIEQLRTRCRAREIALTVGSRYPAANPDNVVQAFASQSSGGTGAEQRFAEWKREDRVAAIQLELGIPLRWPGAWQERFVDCLVESIQNARTHAPAVTTCTTSATTAPSSQTIQFFDPAHRLALFAGTGRMGKGPRAGRLLIFLGDNRTAMFVGEATRLEPGVVAPLHFEALPDGQRIHFRGPMVLLDDARTYFDVEESLSRAELIEGEVIAECRNVAGERDLGLQQVRGSLRIADESFDLNATAVAHDGRLRAGGGTTAAFTAIFDGGNAIAAWHRSGGQVAIRTWGESPSAGEHDAQRLQANEHCVKLQVSAGNLLELKPLSHMTVLRPAPGGAMRVTFGTATATWNGKSGFGTFEIGKLLPQVAEEPERI